MYKLCKIMFIVSIIGLILNLGMRIFYGNDPNSFSRSIAFLVFSFTSFWLMKYYKSQRK